MIGSDADPAARARALRATFDGSFALPRASSASASENLLVVLVNSRHYALRVTELRGIYPGRKITRLPSADPVLLGIVAIRSQLIPAYGLAALLGSTDEPGDCGWLVTCEWSQGIIALAFDGFIASCRIPVPDMLVPAEREHVPTHVGRVARTPSGTLYIIDTESILQTIAAAPHSTSNIGDGSNTHDDSLRR